VPSARTIARLMTIALDHLTKAQTVTIAAIEQGVPALIEAREIIAVFQASATNRRRLRSLCQAELTFIASR
jgi:hypothetical protein